jgi:N-acetylglucosaminyldiphosphoundecaprenol N-acetyl-beta-D-mannosaminyltransferase
VDAIIAMAKGQGGLVFTPNADHVVAVEKELALRAAYEKVTLSVADGMPLVWASHLLGQPLPERVSGADLLAPLMARAAKEGLGVYLIGGRLGAGEQTKAKLEREYPGIRVVGIAPRTRDLVGHPEALEAVAKDLEQKRPGIAIVALGSPIQEVWSAQISERVRPTVFMGLGSALDVYVGMIPRAPKWMREAGFEWAFRLGSEPKRLWRRYLIEDPKFALIVLRDLKTRGFRAVGRE